MIKDLLPKVQMVKNYSNSFVVELNNSCILIDCGMDKKAKEILKIIEKTGKELKAVLITHGHLDHINGLAKIKEKFPDALVVSSQEDKLAVEGKEVLLPKGIKGFFFRMLIPLVKSKGVKVDETFRENYAQLKVIKTPGHTKGSVSFLLSGKTKVLFCGDLILNPNKLSLPPEDFNWNKQKMVESIEKISKLDFDCLLPGHGEAIAKDAKKKVLEFLYELKRKQF